MSSAIKIDRCGNVSIGKIFVDGAQHALEASDVEDLKVGDIDSKTTDTSIILKNINNSSIGDIDAKLILSDEKMEKKRYLAECVKKVMFGNIK